MLVLKIIILVIVGPDGGSQQELLETAVKLGISDNVIFTGPLYGQKKVSAYRRIPVCTPICI